MQMDWGSAGRSRLHQDILKAPLIDSEVANDPDVTANTAVPAGFAAPLPAERFIGCAALNSCTQYKPERPNRATRVISAPLAAMPIAAVGPFAVQCRRSFPSRARGLWSGPSGASCGAGASVAPRKSRRDACATSSKSINLFGRSALLLRPLSALCSLRSERLLFNHRVLQGKSTIVFPEIDTLA